MQHRVLGLLMLFFALCNLAAQEPPSFSGNNIPPALAAILEPEDAPSYLDLSTDDARVDLFLFGEWKSTLSLSFGWLIDTASGSGSALALPEFPSQPFKNSVDLLLSLWIDQEFFVDLSFQDGFGDNRFLLGFSSLDPEFWLQKLWVGNQAIGIGRLALFPESLPRNFSPGIRSEFKSLLGSHELFVRLDSRQTDDRLFLGTTEITQTSSAASTPVRGKYFQLPFSLDQAELAALAVWVESSETGAVLWTDGGGTDARALRFRRLNPGSEYSVNPDSGALWLAQAADGAVLVELQSLPSPDFPVLEVEQATVAALLLLNETEVVFGSAQDSDFESKVLDPLDAAENPDGMLGTVAGVERLLFSGPSAGYGSGLLLYDPGRFSPFENLSYYGAENPVRGVQPLLYIPDPAALHAIPGGARGGRLYALPAENGDSEFRVLADPSTEHRYWYDKWPLMSLSAANSAEYFPTNSVAGSLVLAQAAGTLTGEIILDRGLEEAAIQVFRDNAATNSDSGAGSSQHGSWTYWPETGKLELTPPPGPDELIRVRISTVGFQGSGFAGLGDLLRAGTQHSFDLGDGGASSLTLALDGVYPLSPDQAGQSGWADTDGQSDTDGQTGQASLQAALRFNTESENFDLTITIDALVSDPNPYGALHQLRDSRVGQNLVLLPNRVGLGGVPALDAFGTAAINLSGGDTAEVISDALTNANRAPIRWADSWGGSIAAPLPQSILSSALPSATAASIESETFPAASLAGPIPVLGSSSAATKFSGLGYRADVQFGANEFWASFQLPILLQSDKPPLPQSISFAAGPVTENSLSDPVDIYIQIGLLGEDANKNGKLDGGADSGPSTSLGQGSRTTQTSGYDWLREYRSGLSQSPPSEDLDGDGFLRQTDGGQVVTWYLGKFAASSSGEFFRLSLPAQLRQLIAQTSTKLENAWSSRAQLRVLVVRDPSDLDDTGGAAVAIGDIVLEYPSLPVVADANASGFSVSAGPPSAAGSPPTLYNEVPGSASSSTAGWTLDWDSNSTAGSIATTGLSLQNQADYRYLYLLYYYNGNYDITVLDAAGSSIALAMSGAPAQAAGWYVLRVDLGSRRWAVFDAAKFSLTAGQDQAELSGTHKFSATTSSLGIEATNASTAAGTLHIHKLVSALPILRLAGGLGASTNASLPDLLVGSPDFPLFAAPSISASGKLGLDSRAAGLLDNAALTTSIDFVLLSADIGSYLDLDSLFASVVRAAGHNLRVGPQWLSVFDTFDWSHSQAGQLLQHSIWLRIGPGQQFLLSPKLSQLRSAAGLTRSLRLDLESLLSGEDLSWGNKLGIGVEVGSLPLTASRALFLDDYARAWAESFLVWDFSPRSATDARAYFFELSQTLGNAQKAGAGQAATLSLDYKLAPSFPNNSAAAVLHSQQRLGLLLPLDPGTGSTDDAQLNLTYARSASSSMLAGAHGFTSIAQDLEKLGAVLGAYPLAAISPPLIDIFLPWNSQAWQRVEDQRLSSTQQEASLSARFSRRVLGQFADLWLPSSGGLAIRRQSASPGKLPQDVFSFAAGMVLSPINILGSQGIAGIQSGFLSDEYLFQLSYAGATSPGHFDIYSSLRFFASASLLGIGLQTSPAEDADVRAYLPDYFRNKLRLSNTLELASNPFGGLRDSLGLSFNWYSPLPPAPPDFPGLRKGKQWKLVHSDSLQLSWSSSIAELRQEASPQASEWFETQARDKAAGELGLDQIAISADNFSLFLSHASLLVLPDTGYFKLFVDLGIKLLGNEASGWLTHLGGRVGAELLLSF